MIYPCTSLFLFIIMPHPVIINPHALFDLKACMVWVKMNTIHPKKHYGSYNSIHKSGTNNFLVAPSSFIY